MRWLAALLVFGACRIPAEHFIGTGGDDAGGDDGNGNGDGSQGGDAAAAGSRGYILDSSAGIFLVDKDPTTGALTQAGATPTPFGGGQSMIFNRQGTRLFVVNSPGASAASIFDYGINPDGTLANNPTIVQVPSCTPRAMALHPMGAWIAIGCANAGVSIVALKPATGTIDNSLVPNFIPVAPAASATTPTPVFTPDGSCLFTTDPTSPERAHALQFDGNQGTAFEVTLSLNNPPNPRGIAMNPNGTHLYLAGSGQVTTYQIGAGCNLSQMNNTSGPSNVLQAVITGDKMFVAGTDVFGYSIGGGTLAMLPGNPLYSSANTIDAAIRDPAIADLVYFTGRTSGTYPARMVGAQLQVGGALAPGAGSMAFALPP